MLDSCCISIGLVFIKDRPVSSFWVLRFRSRVLRFRVLGASFSRIGCFVLRSSFSKLPEATQGPEEMCLSLEHQNPSKTSGKMGYFDRVTVSLHILLTANQGWRNRKRFRLLTLRSGKLGAVKVTRPSFLGGYHPSLKLSGIPTFTFYRKSNT